MGKKKNIRGRESSRFKPAPPQATTPSTESARDFESLVASLRTPDELEHRSWQAAITVKNATIWMLVATVAILIATIALPFAVEIFKARFTDAPNHQPGVEARRDQRVTFEASTPSPADSGVATISTTQTRDSQADSFGVSRSNETGTNLPKPSPFSLVASYLKQARIQYHNNHYPEALTVCEKALSLDPHNQAAITLRNQIRATAQIMSENDKARH